MGNAAQYQASINSVSGDQYLYLDANGRGPRWAQPTRRPAGVRFRHSILDFSGRDGKGAATTPITSGGLVMREHINNDARLMLAALKQAVRDAWLVFARLPDADARFRRGLRSGWTLPVVNAASDAYGYASASARDEYPSPRDISRIEIVMEWLVSCFHHPS